MNFADLNFWGYLLLGMSVILAGHVLVRWWRPAALQKFDQVSLLCLGMFLLFCVNYLTFVIWLAVALGTYAGVWWILRHHEKTARFYLAILIPLQLAPLFFYKYADFCLNGVFGLGFNSLYDLIIPAGLSFYTFQKIAFVIDVLNAREPLPKLLDYLNFAGFFPQIVAGPIERKHDLLPQMQRFRFRWDPDDMNTGVSWMVVGLFFKCCLADNLAFWMDNFSRSTSNAYSIWAANLIFGLRIYYDFAGYSLVALGVARCLGVQLTLNFASPYCSTTIQEFWRRWHVTLSQWFRDYLYIPLGGGRTGYWAANIAVVFIISGIWHGAGWNFVLWGAIHGLFLIFNRLGKNVSLPAFISWLMTMVVVSIAWLCFYETRSDFLWLKLAAIFSPERYTLHALRDIKYTLSLGEWAGFISILALAFATLFVEWFSIRFRSEPYVLLRRPLILGALVVMTILLAPDTNNSFIYFAF